MPRCPTCYRRLIVDRICPEHPDAEVQRRTTLKAEPLALPGYQVRDRLGGGGFAVVWSALRQQDGVDVAIKVGHVTTAKAGRRFEREALALARVGSPHVPTLYEHGRLDDGRPYLVMELLRASSLASWLGGRGKPPKSARLLEVVDAVLASLTAVHEAGLVHGDLKPENIMVTTSPTVQAKLLDFGAIRAASSDDASSQADNGVVEDEREETMEEIVGSAEYMAPEQLLGVLEPAVDIYAAGVLIYEMLTLRAPFVGDVASIRHGHRALRPPRPGQFTHVAEPMESLCLRCLAKEPGKRPRDVTELRHLLMDAVARSASSMGRTDSTQSHIGSSVLSDARQPVVLLATEVDVSTRSVVHVVERHKGVVARQIGRRYVCGFSALDDAEPIRSALDTARELVQRHGARVVLHIAQLKVRRRRRGHAARFFGPAIQDVRSWKPSHEWRGILFTEKVAEALPDKITRQSTAHPGFFELVPETEDGHVSTEPTLLRVPVQVSFTGRDDVMSAAHASLRAVLDHRSPGLFTVYGDSGMGKSRLGHELAGMARRLAPDAVILWVRATRQILGRPDETLRTLLELLTEHNLAKLPRTGDFDVSHGTRLLGNGLRSKEDRPVVLIVDDAHYADGGTLDALEYATLDGDHIPLWVVVLGRSRLRLRRPRWGERANRHEVLELTPLSEESAMELAAALLQPAEYPPAATLRRLARWAGGSPHALDELVRTVKREGMVRKRPQSDSWYVATAAIEGLPASPAGQWLAARRLDALPVELAACIRLCAVLGAEFLRDELEWVQNAADRSGAASSSIDTDVGLNELERLGFLEPRGEAWSFRQAAFQDAVYNLVGSRECRRIHGDALEFWRQQADESADARVLTAIARHAGASGAATEAADAYLVLGDRARAEHRDVRADQQYSQALQTIAPDDHTRRMRALGGRGRVRYRIQRGRESLQDLREAQQHARALGADQAEADLMLEEATALDWEWQFNESAARVEQARPLVERSDSSALWAKFCCAVGRSHMREGQLAEAIDVLARALERAREFEDDDLRTLGLITMAAALTLDNQYDDALARYEELIALCERSGDRLHLCAAYANKGLVWTEGSEERVEHDLSRAVELAREVGQPSLERNATHNLAEFLLRTGKHTEALTLARRSYELQRFFPEPTHIDALLVARAYAALEQFDDVADTLELVRVLAESLPLTQSESITLSMLELMSAEYKGQHPGRERWDELIARARTHLPAEELLDVLYFRARAAAHTGNADELRDALRDVQPLLSAHPVSRGLFSQFSQ